MPRIKSAKKALRVSQKKAARNLATKTKFRLILKQLDKAEAEKQKKLISEAFSAIDKAAKKKVIHPNKAARLKRRISSKFKMIKAEKRGRSVSKPKSKKQKTTKKNK